ncbi:hypothetical protein BC629DRAFT_1436013 [Irpex lacteus]|nr:hypothetical protein BC629DRAFT_1436013 [Irpex lacteus]
MSSASSTLRKGRYQSSKRTKCNICKTWVGNRGFAKHWSACDKAKAADEAWDALQAEQSSEEETRSSPSRLVARKRPRRGTRNSADLHLSTEDAHAATIVQDEEHLSPVLNSPSPDPSMPEDGPQVASSTTQDQAPSELPPYEPLPPAPASGSHLPQPPLDVNPPPHPPTTDSTAQAEVTPNVDDIRVEYHPGAGMKPSTIVYPFDQYRQVRPEVDFASTLDEPWRPFQTRGDFEFAEIVHESRMSHAATERLLKLIRGVQTGEVELTFNSQSDVRRAWEKASDFYPMFSKSTVSAVYKKTRPEYDFHHRPMWDWVVQQIEDPKLAPFFHWDAQKLWIYDGHRWVRFWEEPWTAEMFWDVQSDIVTSDDEGKPVGLIVWADKSKLSTFGTQKGHPIVVRLSNLDATIRNGGGVGAGRVVGMVPVIHEPAGEKYKKNYIDWKNAIYHETFRILLEQIYGHSRTGYRLKCGDNKERTVYPFVHIITADYEEQCFLALTRGLHGLAPCPICLIPEGELSNLSATYAEREEGHAQALVEKVEGKGIKDKKLKHFGLRAVKNSFWDVMRTNIYKALSFDRLHAYHLGIFLHVLKIMKLIVEKLSRKAQTLIDDCGLADTDFNDGGKWADLSKIIIQCSYSVFPVDSYGFKLLKVLRKYIECDTYVALSVQTEDTLTDYDTTIQEFGKRLQWLRFLSVTKKNRLNTTHCIYGASHQIAAIEKIFQMIIQS